MIDDATREAAQNKLEAVGMKLVDLLDDIVAGRKQIVVEIAPNEATGKGQLISLLILDNPAAPAPTTEEAV